MAERIIEGKMPANKVVEVYNVLYRRLETTPPTNPAYTQLLNLLEGLKAVATENNIPIEVNVGDEVSNLLNSIGLS